MANAIIVPPMLLILAAGATPDMTSYGLFESWTRFGVAVVSMFALVVLSTRTMPNREREKDKVMGENITAILKSSEEKMRMVVDTSERQHDKVCDRIEGIKIAFEASAKEGNSILRDALNKIIDHKG